MTATPGFHIPGSSSRVSLIVLCAKMCETNTSGGRIRGTRVQRLFSASVRSEITFLIMFAGTSGCLMSSSSRPSLSLLCDSSQLGTLVVILSFAGPVLLFGIMTAIVGVIVFVPIMVNCLGFFSFDFKESLCLRKNY